MCIREALDLQRRTETERAKMEDEKKVVQKTDEELKELEDRKRERVEIEADPRQRAEARRAG